MVGRGSILWLVLLGVSIISAPISVSCEINNNSLQEEE